MLNKKFTWLVTLLISGVSIFYLSFTRVAQRVDREAEIYATDEDGSISYKKKKAYLKEKEDEVVYSFLHNKYTLKEVREKELALGLDFKRGVHITLRISAPDIIRELVGEVSHEPKFLEVFQLAQKKYKELESGDFVEQFYLAHQELFLNTPFNNYFISRSKDGGITPSSTDNDVLKFIRSTIISEVKRSLPILDNRINQSGLSQVTINQTPNSDTVEVELPGVADTSGIKKLLADPAKLVFYLVEQDRKKIESIYSELYQNESLSRLKELLIIAPKGNSYMVLCKSENEEEIREILNSDLLTNIPIMEGYKLIIDAYPSERNENSYFSLYLVSAWGGEGLLEGNIISNADISIVGGKYHVTLKMNRNYINEWYEITKKYIGSSIAITLDDQVYSAPTLQVPIPNGHCSISGKFTIEEANQLIAAITSGSLPASFNVESETIIGPTLGKLAQKQGLLSMLIALILILFFMLSYYAGAGGIANIALFINLLFTLGFLAAFQAVFTLSGVAALLLSCGMSVDGCVLLFEAIRNNLRAGISKQEAIRKGYSKASSAIIDSNITTLIVGLVLYFLGQGIVKGFAIVLILAIGTNLFTSVILTRLLIMFFGVERIGYSFKWTESLLTQFKINFYEKRKFAYLFSFIFITVGMMSLYKNGLPMGVDFKGGRTYVFSFDNPVELKGLKNKLEESLEGSSVSIRNYGTNNTIKITTGYLTDTSNEEIDKEVEAIIIKGLEEATGSSYVDSLLEENSHIEKSEKTNNDSFTLVRSSRVGASIAENVVNAAKLAILLALLLIFLYILLRFGRWQYSLTAILALLHDILGVFAAVGMARQLGVTYELDQVVFTSLLTLIGYSINDTIVVYDALRLEGKFSSINELIQKANKAMNITLSRTLITSFTTLLTVLVLFFFGGESLKGFSFTMTIGILFGTYSSVMIATPLSIDLIRLLDRSNNKGNMDKEVTKN